jgi:hypothetical protein
VSIGPPERFLPLSAAYASSSAIAMNCLSVKLQWLVPDAAGTDVFGAPAAVYLEYFSAGKF